MLGELKFNFARQDILARVKNNRDTHAEEYATALKGYYLEVQEQLDTIAKEARKAVKLAAEENDPERLAFEVMARKPENHTTDYDRVIDMLELAQNAEIELDEQEFAQYVRDEWTWKRVFAETAGFYNSKFGARLNP